MKHKNIKSIPPKKDQIDILVDEIWNLYKKNRQSANIQSSEFRLFLQELFKDESQLFSDGNLDYMASIVSKSKISILSLPFFSRLYISGI